MGKKAFRFSPSVITRPLTPRYPPSPPKLGLPPPPCVVLSARSSVAQSVTKAGVEGRGHPSAGRRCDRKW